MERYGNIVPMLELGSGFDMDLIRAIGKKRKRFASSGCFFADNVVYYSRNDREREEQA